ncbi:glycosyltransferase family 1 protein [Paenibacillus sp. FSL F4-0125]|uniref:glycosyltransferase family 1 protein n=1 Tax=Paenibacillus sp. FSL F4-0125 TaxID=2954730 RepID=UPI0030FCA52A
MMKVTRVLHVLAGLGNGGTEAFLMNLYRSIDRDKVQFDFLLRDSKNNQYEEEILKMGGRIYLTSDYPRHALKNFFEVNKFLKEHKEYKIVHVHGNSLMYITPLILAKKHKIASRIMHSHNTMSKQRIYKLFHFFNRLLISRFTTDLFACSEDAGKWMFGNKQFTVVNNGIDVIKFIYSEEKRKKIRKEFSITEKLVVGNIGRFVEQKNHSFLIDVFYEVLKKNEDSVLMLVGSGELEDFLKKKIRKLQIENKVIFTGVRDDIPDLLQAMDIFLFPSLFEGLGIVLIEAQAASLKCITSKNVVPKETNISELIEYVSLNESVKIWADKVLDASTKYNRVEMKDKVENMGFSIEQVSKGIQEFYEKV